MSDPTAPRPWPRPDWSPLPHPGCHGVGGRVLQADEDLVVAWLRFEPQATIHEHPAPFPIDVCCLSGRGWTSVGDQRWELCAGQRIRWPAGVAHRMWTEGEEMETLMLERRGGAGQGGPT